MYLEIDMGNTRIKWRIRDGSCIYGRGACLTGEWEDSLGSELVQYQKKLTAIYVASVVSFQFEETFSDWCLQSFSLAPCFAKSAFSAGGVTSGYTQPETLGVDRWLAIVAAHNKKHSACLVVSLGTAITVDLVDRSGRHLGGFIGPGFGLSLRSLLGATKRIECLSEPSELNSYPGLSTDSAVYAGVVAMLCGLVSRGLDRLKAATDSPIEIFLTGGDARKLKPFYPDASVVDELVLDGLAYVIPSSGCEILG